MPIGYFLSAATKGMSEAQSIIFLILISGGVIAVIRKTGTIDAFLMSAVLMAALAIAKVPYTAWLKFIVPLIVKIMLLACVYLVLSIHFPL